MIFISITAEKKISYKYRYKKSNIAKIFLKSFWKKNSKKAIMQNIIRGTLLPEKIIPKEITINREITDKLKIVLFFIWKNNINENKEKIQNLCRKEPAINSEPNGPDSLLPSALIPNKSNPTKYWKIISILTNTEQAPNDKNSNL